jgi:REP-associated tyrosine transposase
MQLEKGYLYHIYNQGNNSRKIFFKNGNYIYFKEKIKMHIKPYADILAWCLMPNHFHLMVLVKEEEISIPSSDTMTSQKSEGFTLSETLTKRSFNDSIGIMLRSYTRAINKQEGLSGSLFRKETKAECINCFKGASPSFIGNKMTPSHLITEKQYPQVCFNYIHQNPVKAKLAKKEIDWEFSSARAYVNPKNEKLINREVALKYIDF